ncbi:MAG: hypothetical protein NZ740_09210 [Kiritimatiellae bacterium]|nr:hypothetical protein [Kiritimatiellia bacterium]MDW8459271.1 hypothetical protein [Verrucomicrobiota bacterium]
MNLLRLAALPLIGVLLIALSIRLHREQLRLRLEGVKTAGLIDGMAIHRGGGYDVVSRFDVDLSLRLADGTVQQARFRNGEPMDPLPDNEKEAQRLRQAALDDVERLRWLLRRESRRPDDPRRVVALTKTETVTGYFGLKTLPPRFIVRDGIVHPDPAGEAQISEVITRVEMVGDPQRVRENKGDWLVSFSQIRGGEPYTPAKRNFLLHCEPYSTVFRPVFQYTVNGIEYAAISHIGRHGGPTLALRLFHRCWVYYDPNAPENALLMADPGPVDGKPLDWFSRFCEGLFAQWGTASLIIFAGSIFIACGLILISLGVSPSRSLIHQSS